jgi:hypothetical protein
MLPRIGDWVLIAGKPSIVMPEWQASELVRQENAPPADLSTGDYLCVKLLSGTIIEVKDIASGCILAEPLRSG